MSYEFKSKIRYSAIGPDGRLTLGGLVDYFQDCCVFHSESIGFGPDAWAARKAGWVIASWQIVINEYPKLSTDILVKTWAYRFHLMEGDRNLTMRAADDGRLLAYADSRWIFYDMEKQRPCRIPEAESSGYGTEERLVMEGAPRHIEKPEEMAAKRPFKVRITNLDTNQHVNNEQYIRMATGYLPLGYVTRELRVEYHRQAKLNDVIYPKCGTSAAGTAEDSTVISLDNAEGIPYAIVQFIRR